MCALRPWPQRYDIDSRSGLTLGSLTKKVWNIKIQHASKKLWPGHESGVCMHYGLGLWYMTLFQGYDTSLCPGHRLCEILSRYNIVLRSYDPDTNCGYICSETLTLEIWPESRSWHTLRPWTTILWNIIQIQHENEELWPEHRFWECINCDIKPRHWKAGLTCMACMGWNWGENLRFRHLYLMVGVKPWTYDP